MNVEMVEPETAQEPAAPVVLPAPQRAALALNSSATELALKELTVKSANITAVLNGDGREECHRVMMTLKKARTSIEKTGKAAREDANAFIKATSAEEKRLISITLAEEERLTKLRDDWDSKIEAEKEAARQAELARIAAINEKIAALTNYSAMAAACRTSTGIAQLLLKLDAVEITIEEYQEFTSIAIEKRTAIRDAIVVMMKSRAADEEERTRLAAAKAAEEERMAAERAALAAQKAEQEKAQAELAAQFAAQQEQLRIQQEEFMARQAEFMAKQAEWEWNKRQSELMQAEEKKRQENAQAALQAAEEARRAELAKPADVALAESLKELRELVDPTPMASAMADAVATGTGIVKITGSVEPAVVHIDASSVVKEEDHPITVGDIELRPMDDEILQVLCDHYDITKDVAIAWLKDMDLDAAADQVGAP